MTTTIIFPGKVVRFVGRPVLGAVVIMMAVAMALSGCLGSQEDVSVGGVGVADVPPMSSEANHPALVTPTGNVSLVPWLADLGAVHAEPNERRQMQLAYLGLPSGQMRLTTDGQAFYLLVQDEASPPGAWLFARVVDVANAVTVARAVALADGVAAGGLAPMVAYDPVRIDGRYALEAYWFVPAEETLLAPPYEASASEPGARLSPTEPGIDTPDPRWNGTLHARWETNLTFRPSWGLSFDGPDTGTDANDAVERGLFGGPKLGTYEVMVTGERIWLADLLLEFDESVVAGSTPDIGGNGSASVAFQLDGAQHVDAHRTLLRDEPGDQSFKLTVSVDWETGEDFTTEAVEQFFFVTMQVGYRVGGTTYVADSDGRDILVTVTPTLLP